MYWSPDLNTYIQDNKIRLKEGKTAGAIILKNPVSSFLGFEIKFKSSFKPSNPIGVVTSIKQLLTSARLEPLPLVAMSVTV